MMKIIIVSDLPSNYYMPSSKECDIKVVTGQEFLAKDPFWGCDGDSFKKWGFPDVVMTTLNLIMTDGEQSPISMKGPFGAMVALQSLIIGVKYVGLIHHGNCSEDAGALSMFGFGSHDFGVGSSHRHPINNGSQFVVMSSGSDFYKYHPNWKELLKALLHIDCRWQCCLKK